MSEQSGKSLVRDALSFKENTIPVDFGSTAITGIHSSVIEGLREHYGLEKKPVRIQEPYQMLGTVDEDLQNLMGINTQPVLGQNTIFGFPMKDWKEFRTPWGQVVEVPGDFNVTYGKGGDVFIYPEGDTSVPPSGRMPFDGMFFDSICRQEENFEENLTADDNLDEFSLITDQDVMHFVNEIDRANATGRAVVATLGGTAIGDIALVPAPWRKKTPGIRDITEWYVSTVMRQDLLHEVFSRQVDIALENLSRINKAVGQGRIDAVYICGTDFGTQTSAFCSTDTFDTLYAPYYKKMNDWIHSHTDWKTFKHSCGAIRDFIPGLINSGFDILNPLQFSAAGMDPLSIKKEFGKDLVFWGGGVDTQKTLPFGTPQEVRVQVLERCEILSRGGGFVFNTIHNIQAKTPVENVVAMVDAVKEFQGEK